MTLHKLATILFMFFLVSTAAIAILSYTVYHKASDSVRDSLLLHEGHVVGEFFGSEFSNLHVCQEVSSCLQEGRVGQYYCIYKE